MPNRILKLSTVKKNPITFLALGNDLSYQDRTGTGTLTASGPVRYQPGNGGRVNLVSNPSAVLNATGWGVENGTAISDTKNLGQVGTTAFKCVRNSMASNFGLFGTALTGGSCKITAGLVAYSASCIVYHEEATAKTFTFSANGRTADSSASISNRNTGAISVPPFTPTRLSLTNINFGTAGSNIIRLELYNTGGATMGLGGVFWATNFQVEQASSLGPYFDGSAPGCAWADPTTGIAGTAHASPSISKAAFWIEEQATNAVINPSFETNTTGWVGAGSATISRDTTYALYGSASCKVVADGSIANQGVQLANNQIAASSGQSWTFSLWLRGSGTVYLTLAANDSGGVFLSGTSANSTDIVLTDTWTRYSVSGAPVNASIAFVQAFIRTRTASPATFYVDGVQVELKPFATSYTDGSLGTGYTWSGTAHASSSTRSAAMVTAPATVDNFNPTQGSIVMRWRPGRENGYAADGKFLELFNISGGAANGPTAFRDSTGARIYSYFGSSFSNLNPPHGLATNDATHHFWAWTWATGALAYQYLDGTLKGTRATAITDIFSGKTTINIGTSTLNSDDSSIAGPFAIFDRTLTADELALLQNTDPRYWWNLLGP